jgi:hypothetical protein
MYTDRICVSLSLRVLRWARHDWKTRAARSKPLDLALLRFAALFMIDPVRVNEACVL